MKKNTRFLLVFCLFFIISGCSSNQNEEIAEKNLVETDIEISEEMNNLDKSSEFFESTETFTQVKGFLPADNILRYEQVQDEAVEIIKLEKDEDFISGTIVLENNTEENMSVRSLFFQGNTEAKVKSSSSKEWGPYIEYDVPPKTAITINVHIDWDKKGMRELLFFPLDYTEEIGRYDGTMLSAVRFFVADTEAVANNEMIEEQAFEVDDIEEVEDFLLSPVWIDEEKEEVAYHISNNDLLTEEKIAALKLNAVPYDTTIDVLLLDEVGNSSLLNQNVLVQKGEPTILEFSSEVLSRMNDDKNKSFILIINNRGENMLADLKALDERKKPFLTSQQAVLQFYKSEE